MAKKIGFIGLGVIGGSLAKAIRKYHPTYDVIAYDINRESLALALQEGTITIACVEIDYNFRDCDYIFLCAPVSDNTAHLSLLKDYIDSHCILTDVGSVKTSIHQEIIAQGLEEVFIGGHPMAGSERNGFANAKAHLIENAYYILTPSAKVASEKVEAYQTFITSLKALPVVLDYQQHDFITGTISHLPHIIAFCLVNQVRGTDTPDEWMKTLAAGGFKDITRIASSSPLMWQQICLENRDQITHILDSYIAALSTTRDAIQDCSEQELYSCFESAKDYRDSISDISRGSIRKVFALYCDIVDEAGGIAIITTILASNQINIKNMGIVHNREFVEGALCIEFYDDVSFAKATELLAKYHYSVYTR